MATEDQASQLGDTGSGKQLWRRVAIALIALIGALFVGVAIISRVADLPKVDWEIRPGWLILSFVILLLGVQMHAAIYHSILTRVGGVLHRDRSYAIWTTSLLTRYVPTQLLMPITRVTLSAREGVPKSVSVTAIAYETLLSLGVAIATSLLYVVSLPEIRHSPLRIIILGVPAVLLAAAHPRVVDYVIAKLAQRFGLTSAHVTMRKRDVAAVALAYLVSFAVLGLGVYLVAQGIHPVGKLTLKGLTSYAVGFAASLLAFFAPAGLGAREGATAGVLAPITGVSTAVATVVVVRLMGIAVELLLAGAWTAAARRSADRA